MLLLTAMSCTLEKHCYCAKKRKQTMLESLKIRNFRILDDFDIERLASVNLFAGLNNSGKTALLEALFLMSGFGNPHIGLNSNVTRGGFPEPVPIDVIRDVFCKPMFSTLDMKRSVEITGNHRRHGTLTLRISRERSDVTVIPLKGTDEVTSISAPLNDLVLQFSFERGSRVSVKQIRFTNQGVKIDPPDTEEALFQAIFLSSRNVIPREEAIRLGQLRVRKQEDLILESLRTIEPRLKSIEDNSASGHPMIWGDIGLQELVPLQILGEGMTRVARLILAISAAENGIVLVDEIETGLHYSVLPKVWEAIDMASKKFNTQIFATTHSFECTEAAHSALEQSSFLFHRLEADGMESRCITYGPEEIDAAIRHDFEVR